MGFFIAYAREFHTEASQKAVLDSLNILYFTTIWVGDTEHHRAEPSGPQLWGKATAEVENEVDLDRISPSTFKKQLF